MAELARLQVKVGGMHCSFCAQTIERAVRRLDGVEQVNVSLAHEEALIGYHSGRVTPSQVQDTLRQLGYTVRDPRKIRGTLEQQAELSQDRVRLAAAASATVVVLWLMLLMATGRDFPLLPWLALALSVLVVFVIAWTILAMAVQSVRRGILNQHVRCRRPRGPDRVGQDRHPHPGQTRRGGGRAGTGHRCG